MYISDNLVYIFCFIYKKCCWWKSAIEAFDSVKHIDFFVTCFDLVWSGLSVGSCLCRFSFIRETNWTSSVVLILNTNILAPDPSLTSGSGHTACWVVNSRWEADAFTSVGDVGPMDCELSHVSCWTEGCCLVLQSDAEGWNLVVAAVAVAAVAVLVVPSFTRVWGWNRKWTRCPPSSAGLKRSLLCQWVQEGKAIKHW